MVKTVLVKAVHHQIDKKGLRQCVEALAKGGVVIFPTDTVYGMACNAFHPEAVQRIYDLKGRSYTKPLPIFLKDSLQLPLVAQDPPPEVQPLLDTYWPGPLTLVFKTAPMALLAAHGKSTVAVRVPDHGVVRQILTEFQLPLATTSANRSGQASLKKGSEVIREFSGKVDVIIEDGWCLIGRESTILDVSHFPFSVLRSGAVSKEKLVQLLKL